MLRGQNELRCVQPGCGIVCRDEITKSMTLNFRVKIAVADVQPKPCRIAHVVLSGASVGRVEVDESLRNAVNEHAIAWAGVAMADDFIAAPQRAIGGRVVERSQQLGSGNALRIAEFTKFLRHFPRKKGENFPPLRVHSQIARRSPKSSRLQVPE